MMFVALFALFPLFADLPASFPQEEPKEVVVHNRVLVKVRDATISVLDVVKEMDVYLDRNYPHLSHSPMGRYQFYLTHWRDTLDHMIDNELIVADAESREIKVSDGEVREELQQRFGPNVMASLEKLHLTYEEARKMVQKEMIVQRMQWFRVYAKAFQKVTPQVVKKAYQQYREQNPPTETWKYRMLSIRASDEKEAEKIAELAKEYLQEASDFVSASEKLKAEFSTDPSVSITLSPEYTSEDKELSSSHRETLLSLSKGGISSVVAQKSRDGTSVFRFFYLLDHTKKEVPKFDEMANEQKENLLQQVANQEMAVYMAKLRDRFNYDAHLLQETIPSDFEPFSLQ